MTEQKLLPLLTNHSFLPETKNKVTLGIEKFRGKAATIYNAHIAKIAALPRVDRFCVFSLPLLALIKCWNAATSAICRNVGRKRSSKI